MTVTVSPAAVAGPRESLAENSRLYGALCIAVVAIVCIPELFLDRIHPSDGSLFALNGALFHAIGAEFGEFARDPGAWLWSYYEQYPALNVRRYPPLFGLVEAGVFSITGVGILGAKLALFLFAVVFAACVFLFLRRMLADNLLAFCACALLLAVPTVQDYLREVWLDIPCIALVLAATLFYVRCDPGRPTLPQLLPFVATTLAALYIYQLAMYLLAGLGLFVAAEQRSQLWRNRALLIATALLIVALVPLLLQALLLSPEDIGTVLGNVFGGRERYSAEASKASLEYWTYYATSLWHRFPVQLGGAALWVATRAWIPSTREQRMFLCMFLVAYTLMSYMPARDPRYLLHIAVPLSFVAAQGIVDAVRLLARTLWGVRLRIVTASVLTGILAIQAALLQPATEYYWIAGTELPAQRVLAADGELNVLYSGPYSAAFVLALRKLDADRRVHVQRGTVQLAPGGDVAEFLGRHAIDFIVLETSDSRTGQVEFDQLRDAILGALRSGGFERVAAFGLPLGRVHHDEVVEVLVYQRIAGR